SSPTPAQQCVNRTKLKRARREMCCCPPLRTLLVPRNALTPKRESRRAKRYPFISTRAVLSADPAALSFARGRLAAGRDRRSRASNRSNGSRSALTGTRARSLARRRQLFVRFDAPTGARDRRLAAPRALATPR